MIQQVWPLFQQENHPDKNNHQERIQRQKRRYFNSKCQNVHLPMYIGKCALVNVYLQMS